MNELIIYFFFRLKNIFLAPLYFHFGHHWWFIEAMTVLSDSGDTVAIYFISFILVAILAFYRNSIFQSFTKVLYKNYTLFQNTLPLFAHFSVFFKNFLKLTTSLLNHFSSFFKKLRK